MNWKSFPLLLLILGCSNHCNAISNATNNTRNRVIIFVKSNIAKEVTTALSKDRNETFHVSGFQAGDGLSKFANGAKVLQSGSRSDMLYSFLDEDSEKILQRIASYKNMDYLAFQSSKCQMNLYHCKHKWTCKRYPQGYIMAARSVIDYFQLKKIAIITSNDICEKNFAERLYNEIFLYQKRSVEDIHGHLLLKKYEFNADVINARELKNIVYATKFFDVSVVIVVCQSEIAEMVFKTAMKYSMLSYNRIWMTVDYKESDDVKLLPQQLINIVDESMKDATWSERQIVNMSLTAVGVMSHKHKKQTDGCKTREDAREWKSTFTRLSTKFSSMECPGGYHGKVKVLHRQPRQQWVDIFSYNKKTGVVLSSKNTDFHKIFSPPAAEKFLKVVTVIDKPFTATAHQYYRKNAYKEYPCEKGLSCQTPIVTANQTKWNATCCIGHSIDLLQKLARDLYFTPTIYVVEDGYYGSKIDGQWVGMIGDLVKKKADIAIAGLSINNMRSAAVDLTAPFMRVELGILISTKNQETSVVNFRFISYITERLLWCLLGIFLVGLVLVYCFENEQLLCGRKPRVRGIFLKRKTRKRTVYSWKEGFTYFSGLTFQRDLGGKNPAQYGARVTAVVFAFGMVITMTAYTAVLTASSVKQEERNPFLGIKDERMINPSKEFRFGTVSATTTETFFRDVPDPVLRRMYFFMKKYNTKSTTEGINNILYGKIEGFVNEKPFLQYHVSKQRDCILRIVDLSISHISYGIALQKNSPWTHALSITILKYQDNGDILELDKKWLSGGCSNAANLTKQHESYSTKYFGGLFVILLSASIIAFLILSLEHIYDRYHEKVVSPFELHMKKWKELRERRKIEAAGSTTVAPGIEESKQDTNDTSSKINKSCE